MFVNPEKPLEIPLCACYNPKCGGVILKTEQYTWEQIVDILIQEYESGSFQKDQKLPTENELAVRFFVPRTVIRKAYEKLKALGYIYSVRGYGSYFKGKSEKISLNLNDNSSFSEKMKQNGYHYYVKNIGCQKIEKNSSIYKIMKAPTDDTIYRISLLRLVEQEPVAIHSTYLSTHLFADLAQNGNTIVSVYEYMRSHGFASFSDADMELTVTLLNEKQRKLLGITGCETGLTLSSRCIEPQSGQLLAYSSVVYRCDKFKFLL